MNVVTTDGRWFALQAECEADTAFLDAIDMALQQVHVVRMLRTDGRNTAAFLSADRADPRALKAEASRRIAGAVSQLACLLQGESALRSYARLESVDPEPPAELAERIGMLQNAMEAKQPAVRADEVRLHPVPGAHGVTITMAASRSQGAP